MMGNEMEANKKRNEIVLSLETLFFGFWLLYRFHALVIQPRGGTEAYNDIHGWLIL